MMIAVLGLNDAIKGTGDADFAFDLKIRAAD
jgi:hypothetical protein